MIGLLFLTNCSEALIGATLLRRISDAPDRFDSLQRLFAFVVSVALLAPVVSSFLDAAVVSSFSAESYWGVWRARTFANVLTAITVVPAVTSVVGYLVSGEPWPPVRRMLEWTALSCRVADHLVRHSVSPKRDTPSSPARSVCRWPSCCRSSPGRRCGSGRSAPA